VLKIKTCKIKIGSDYKTRTQSNSNRGPNSGLQGTASNYFDYYKISTLTGAGFTHLLVGFNGKCGAEIVGVCKISLD